MSLNSKKPPIEKIKLKNFVPFHNEKIAELLAGNQIENLVSQINKKSSPIEKTEEKNDFNKLSNLERFYQERLKIFEDQINFLTDENRELREKSDENFQDNIKLKEFYDKQIEEFKKENKILSYEKNELIEINIELKNLQFANQEKL